MPSILVRIMAIGVSVGLAAAGADLWAGRPRARAAAARPHQRAAEHRYRISGRVRLLLFWSGSAEVGAARMTWRSSTREQSIALLIGSDPRRAPRGLNEWGYMREEVRADEARAFEVRSLTIPGFNPERRTRVGGRNQTFGALCATSTDATVESWTTTVEAGGLSYRAFDGLLDRIAAAPRWEVQRTAQPQDAAAGFLTALERLIRASIEPDAESASATPAALTYVYKGMVYDLSCRKLHRLGRRSIRGAAYDDLARADFSIRNRTTRDVTRFAVTYPTAGPSAGLPVVISFQPNWWLSVDLQLDETADAPADPAADAALLARIRSVCAAAAR